MRGKLTWRISGAGRAARALVGLARCARGGVNPPYRGSGVAIDMKSKVARAGEKSVQRGALGPHLPRQIASLKPGIRPGAVTIPHNHTFMLHLAKAERAKTKTERGAGRRGRATEDRVPARRLRRACIGIRYLTRST